MCFGATPQIIAKEIEIEQAKAGLMGANSRRLPGVGGNLNLASNATATTSNLSTRTRDSGLFYNLARLRLPPTPGNRRDSAPIRPALACSISISLAMIWGDCRNAAPMITFSSGR